MIWQAMLAQIDNDNLEASSRLSIFWYHDAVVGLGRLAYARDCEPDAFEHHMSGTPADGFT